MSPGLIPGQRNLFLYFCFGAKLRQIAMTLLHGIKEHLAIHFLASRAAQCSVRFWVLHACTSLWKKSNFFLSDLAISVIYHLLSTTHTVTMLTNTNNDEGGEAAPPPPNPRLRILKPGDTIILYDHMISKQHRECTVQKNASSDENVPIKLDDFHLSAMIDHDTRFAIARYVTDDGDSISVDSNC